MRTGGTIGAGRSVLAAHAVTRVTRYEPTPEAQHLATIHDRGNTTGNCPIQIKLSTPCSCSVLCFYSRCERSIAKKLNKMSAAAIIELEESDAKARRHILQSLEVCAHNHYLSRMLLARLSAASGPSR